jgi:hypothetical protein
MVLTLNVDLLPAGFPSATRLRAALVPIPLALGVLYSAASWTVLRRKPSADKWALFCCLIPIFLLIYTIKLRPLSLHSPWWIPMIAGAGGVAIFAKRGGVGKKSGGRASNAPIPGDGTSKVGNSLILVAGMAGGIGGVSLLTLWALSHGLHRVFSPFFAIQVIATILLVLAIHEAGHAVAGLAVGMRLIGFIVGPFRWSYTYGSWKFLFRGSGLLAFAGQTMVAPSSMSDFRRRKVIQVAAGPIASLLAGLIAVIGVFTARGTPWEGWWAILAIFADITTLVGLLNVVPFGNKAMYSDGAKLYQLLSGGLWSAYHRAMGMVSATSVSALRPRDYDIATLEQAAQSIAKGGREEAFVCLCAYAYYLDSGGFPEAIEAIEKVEALCQENSIDPPLEWCAAFVFANACLRRDAPAARRWWDRMESAKTFQFSDALLDVRGALLVSENRLDDAEADWKKADEWTRGLPATGQAEVKRNAVKLLRQALNEALAEHGTQARAAAGTSNYEP